MSHVAVIFFVLRQLSGVPNFNSNRSPQKSLEGAFCYVVGHKVTARCLLRIASLLLKYELNFLMQILSICYTVLFDYQKLVIERTA